MTRRAKSGEQFNGSEDASNKGTQASQKSSMGYRDLIVIIAAGSGLVMNVMVGQIYTPPWWVRLVCGLLVFGGVLIFLQILRGFLRWCWRSLRG